MYKPINRIMWEPGVVEVEFRQGVQPTVAPSNVGFSQQVTSLGGVDLQGMNRLLQEFGLRQAEPTFLTPPDEADFIQANALQQGFDLPNLRNFVTLHFDPQTDTVQIARELEKYPDVERAVAVPKAVPPATPLNEPLMGNTDQLVIDAATGLENQWYIFRCGIDHAWKISTGRGVVVADIDWGYRTSHQDLTNGFDMTHAYNSYDGSQNVSSGSDIDHGTGVMGLAGAGDNDLGMSGVAFESDLWPVQANTGPGTALGGNTWARAIDWVRQADSGNKRKVIILEVQTWPGLGNYEMVPSVNAAIRTAIANGVVVCVAAGNGDRDAGLDESGNPIPETGSILVGATEYHPTQNRRAGFSNYGPRIVVCAPGDGLHDVTCNSTGDDDYRNRFGGTSGATPKVAGTVALMLSVNPTLSHAEIRQILHDTGTTVVTDPDKPVGRFLNSEAAVREAQRRRSRTKRLEIFTRRLDHSLYHMWQIDPNGGWSNWAKMGGVIDLLKVGRNQDGRLEIFARGRDHEIWHKWQVVPGGQWSSWKQMGGGKFERLEVAQNQDGRLELFARGLDHGLWHRWQHTPNGGWSNWQSLGGQIESIAVEKNEDGRLEVFVQSVDGTLLHRAQVAPSGGWGNWHSLDGQIDMLKVAQNADGRLEVFARGTDSALWHIWQTVPNGNWSNWRSLGGAIDLIEVARNADGRLEIFARGLDSFLWHRWQQRPNGAWSDWRLMGGYLDLLKVGQNADGRLEIFGRGLDGSLIHRWQTVPNGNWSSWRSLGSQIDMLEIGENLI